MIGAAVKALEVDAPFLLGEHFTGVDILMSTCLEWAPRYELALPDAFHGYHERLLERPAHAMAVAANQPP